MKHNLLKDALLKSLPVLAGYVLIGFGFGIVLRGAGYGLAWALAMSIFIYAGSLQMVGISLLTAPAGLVATAMTSLMINARHLFYSISMIGKYKDAGAYKPYLIFALTDETYALISEDRQERPDRYRFYFLVSLFNQIYWVIGTALGSVFAAALPFDTAGIEFSMTALFVAAYTDQWISSSSRLPAILGLLMTLAGRLMFGRDLFLIPSMIAIAAVLLLLRNRLSAGKEVSR